MLERKSLIGLLAMFGDMGSPDRNKLTQLFYRRRRSMDETFDDQPPDTYLLLEDCDEPVHRQIQELLAREDVGGMVVFRCEDLCSSHLGGQKGVIFGPGCTYKTASELAWRDEAGRTPNLIDAELISTTKWPIAFYEKEPVVTARDVQ